MCDNLLIIQPTHIRFNPDIEVSETYLALLIGTAHMVKWSKRKRLFDSVVGGGGVS